MSDLWGRAFSHMMSSRVKTAGRERSLWSQWYGSVSPRVAYSVIITRRPRDAERPVAWRRLFRRKQRAHSIEVVTESFAAEEMLITYRTTVIGGERDGTLLFYCCRKDARTGHDRVVANLADDEREALALHGELADLPTAPNKKRRRGRGQPVVTPDRAATDTTPGA